MANKEGSLRKTVYTTIAAGALVLIGAGMLLYHVVFG